MSRNSSRNRTITRTLVAFGALVPLLAGGCANQDRMDHSVTANRSLREQIAMMERQRDDARDSLTTVQSQLDSTQSAFGDLQRRYDDLQGSVTGLDAANEASMKRIARLELGALPADVESAIEDLAARHPELLSFDAEMGMVRFSSDFTFDLGSVELKEAARTTLSKLASILTSSSGFNLEARVIGHTDNVPIGKPETRRRHPTNVHLSVHRAIAVRNALTAAGVDPARIQVAGYGEHRPIAANSRTGSATNRRVEIYLAAMPDLQMTQADTAAAPESPATGAASVTTEPMK